MTNHDLMDETDDGDKMWLVRLPNGGVRAVTLEQLDDAYQRDWINGDTEVMEEGTAQWRKLSQLIGEQDEVPQLPRPQDEALQDEDEPTRAYAAYATQIHAVPAAYRTATQVAPEPPASGGQSANHEAYASLASRPTTPAPAFIPNNAYPSSVQQAYPAHATTQQAYPARAATQQAYPARATTQQAYPAHATTQQAYPAHATTVAVSPQRVAPHVEGRSTAPVASDIYDIDLEFGGSPFKRKKGGLIAFAAVGVLAIGGIIAAIEASESAPTPSVAVAAPAHSAVAAPFKPTPLQELEVAEKAKPAPETRLSDDMKKALAEADKQREKLKAAIASSKTKGRAASSSRGHSTERSVFSKGGDSHDPLNGSL